MVKGVKNTCNISNKIEEHASKPVLIIFLNTHNKHQKNIQISRTGKYQWKQNETYYVFFLFL